MNLHRENPLINRWNEYGWIERLHFDVGDLQSVDARSS
jgi:hypothetical protein